MTTKLSLTPLALSLALLTTAPTLAQTSPPQGIPTQNSAAQRNPGVLAGAWRMTSLEVGTPGNLRPVPYSG